MDEKDKIIAELTKRNEELTKLIEELLLRIAKLEKNSKNSSKPPSSDIVKPQKPKLPNGENRKPGGQPGHERNVRPPFELSAVDSVINIPLPKKEQYCSCGSGLISAEIAPRLFQQAEFTRRGIRVTQYQMTSYICPQCGKIHFAKLDPAIKKAGLFGPKLWSLVVYMKGCKHLSIRSIQAFFDDIFNIHVSTGYLCKILMRGSESLEKPYQELADALTKQAIVNIDETGLRTHGARRWVWLAACTYFTLYRISKSRGSEVLIELLGEKFEGIICCDFWSAYKKYGKAGVLLQFCWAHLIRDLRFIETTDNPRAQAYAKRLLKIAKQIFHKLHKLTDDNKCNIQQELRKLQKKFISLATRKLPQNKEGKVLRECQNMANRFISFGDSYFHFVENLAVPPTNNFAEQQIRHVTIDRYITHGCGSDWGELLSERVWTVLATCKQQGRRVLDFLYECVNASLRGCSSPSLSWN